MALCRQSKCGGDRPSLNNAHLIYPEDTLHSSMPSFSLCVRLLALEFLTADKSQGGCRRGKNLNDLHVRLSQHVVWGATCTQLFISKQSLPQLMSWTAFTYRRRHHNLLFTHGDKWSSWQTVGVEVGHNASHPCVESEGGDVRLVDLTFWSRAR